MKNVSLVLSGGSGARFGGGQPKQYQMLMGKEVISYCVSAMFESVLTDAVVIIAGEEFVSRLTDTYDTDCIAGGSSRNESLKIGLDYIKAVYPSCEKVFINEAARPFLYAGLVDSYFTYLDEYDAVITARHITDSLGREGEDITNRAEYYLIQAPEAFRFELLYRHFKAESPITATVQQLPFKRKVFKYFDFKRNMKITYREDLVIAEQLMRFYGKGAT